MKPPKNRQPDNFTSALEATSNLFSQELEEVFHAGQRSAFSAHSEIAFVSIAQKTGPFYRHFAPWRNALTSVLADTYRRCFKLAVAHPDKTGHDPHEWVRGQLQPAIGAAVERIKDWYVLACDGENRHMQLVASAEFVPGQTISIPIPLDVQVSPLPKSWCAPSWLFAVGVAFTGIGFLRSENFPKRDSEEKLGVAHTRLLLAGARRLFLWALEAAVERVRNEELAAAGAIPAEPVSTEKGKAKARPKGFDGLGPKKANLSRYMDGLTEKQREVFSLKYEYSLPVTEIASRLGIDRSTVYEHIEAADKKIREAGSNEKSKANRAKRGPDE